MLKARFLVAVSLSLSWRMTMNLRDCNKTFWMFNAAIFLVSISPAFALIVDDFSAGPFTRIVTGPESGYNTVTQTGLDPAHVLGGSRSYTTGYAYGTVSGSVVASVNTEDDGRFNYDGSGADFAIEVVRLEYEFSPTNLMANGDAFALSVLNADPGSSDLLRFYLYVDSSDAPYPSTVYFTLSKASTPYLLVIPFEEFDSATIANANKIRLAVSGHAPPGATFTFGELAVVPEPATFLLALSAMLLTGRPKRCRCIVTN